MRRLFLERRFPPPEETFHRHQLIGGWDQGKISSTKLLSVGAGSLGGWFDRCAVRMGLATVDILDYDRVEASNLPRQPFTVDDLGKPKAVQLKRHLLKERTNPETRINAYPYSLEKAIELGLPMNYDVAYVGVDSDPTRAYAARLFRKQGIPVIFSGTGIDSKKGYVFIQKSNVDAPCLACMNPAIAKSEIKNGCYGAAADVPVVLAGMAIYALESLLVDRKITWDYWEIMLPTGKSYAMQVRNKQNCSICTIDL